MSLTKVLNRQYCKIKKNLDWIGQDNVTWHILISSILTLLQPLAPFIPLALAVPFLFGVSESDGHAGSAGTLQKSHSNFVQLSELVVFLSSKPQKVSLFLDL